MADAIPATCRLPISLRTLADILRGRQDDARNAQQQSEGISASSAIRLRTRSSTSVWGWPISQRELPIIIGTRIAVTKSIGAADPLHLKAIRWFRWYEGCPADYSRSSAREGGCRRV